MALKVTLILPLLAREDHIEKVLFDHYKGLEETFGGGRFEIILVINGDNNLAQEKIIREMPGRREVIEIRTKQKGLGFAIKEGMRLARGEYICYTNASYAPVSEVIKILRFAEVDNACLVKGSRVLSRESKARQRISFAYNLLSRVVLKIPSLDLNASPKAISRNILNRLPDFPANDGFFDVELLYWCFLNRVSIVEVPIIWEQRKGGKSATTWKTALRFAYGILRLKWLHSRGTGRFAQR